jgi:hypothetical protein
MDMKDIIKPALDVKVTETLMDSITGETLRKILTDLTDEQYEAMAKYVHTRNDGRLGSSVLMHVYQVMQDEVEKYK